MFQPVLSKRDFSTRYRRGEFGNSSPTWETPSELAASGYFGLAHLRNRVVGGATYYNLTAEEALDRWLKEQDRTAWYVSAMAPACYTLNAEVLQTERHLDVHYSLVNAPMRQALASEPRWVDGIMAVLLLRKYLCPNSLEWLYELLERYPGHVVELSSFTREWGTIPGYNTVYWEVRGGY